MAAELLTHSEAISAEIGVSVTVAGCSESGSQKLIDAQLDGAVYAEASERGRTLTHEEAVRPAILTLKSAGTPPRAPAARGSV